jgi:hypothetical protein
MTDYANNGLTSSADFGAVCSFPSATGPGNYGCAFPGINPKAPPLLFFAKTIGRSTYNGLQIRLTDSQQWPSGLVRDLNFQIAYSLSRFKNAGSNYTAGPIGQDQDVAKNSGPSGSLVLSREASSSSASCRFSPAH